MTLICIVVLIDLLFYRDLRNDTDIYCCINWFVILQGSVPSVKTETGLKLNQEDVTRVLNDVHVMKGKQDNMSVKMDKMKK